MQILRSIKLYTYVSLLNLLGGGEVFAYREIFKNQVYKWLYDRITPNTLLLDIGANIGDTAIYFAMNKNVREVWSYECDNKTYARLEETLKHSGFNKRVSPHHMKVTSLDEILSKATKPVAIKCDIEGGEYKLFTKDVDLSKVYAIMMEYHSGLNPIVQNLKAKGFKVSYTEPTQFTLKFREAGYLSAWK
jgi:hypothetical protein